MRRFLTKLSLLVCFFLAAALYVSAQEEAADGALVSEELGGERVDGEGEFGEGGVSADGEGGADGERADGELPPEPLPPVEIPPELVHLDMEIKTSSLMELSTWARELGLSDGGTREDLAIRLRAHYGIPSQTGTPAVEQRVVTIESATTTEYFTLEVVDEDFARFRGNVIISLLDGESVHRISAGEILFNRTRNVLTASGGVQYIREEGNIVETFRGDSITVNLDNWSSLFVDGISERTMSGNPTAYRFAGTIISRDAEGATLLRNADITNPANEEAFWSISASKLWLLPGNDFAILNAVLRVGNIPLFYLPFFYFPADQVVFRPVLGLRTREGTFFQTTTYLLGRPRTEVIKESSIAMIFGGADEGAETKREGIFLRTTGKRRQDPNNVQLALLVDMYVNLGAYVGAELSLPSKGRFGALNVSTGVGFTRNLFLLGGNYTPFFDADGVSQWNSSTILSMEVPFRYRFRMTGSFRLGDGSISWNIPVFSDPFVDRDFMRRPEPKDWFSMLREFAEGTDNHDEGNDSMLGGQIWTVSGGHINFSLGPLNPYISSLSISNISSSLTFAVRNVQPRNPPGYHPPGLPNPDRAFFFPQRFTMFSMNASMAGSPLTLGATPPRPPAPSEPVEAPGLALLPDVPLSPWATENEETVKDADSGEFSFSPPVLGQTFNIRTAAGPRLAVTYRLAPSTATEMHFNSASWAFQEDIDWSDLSLVESRAEGSGNLNFTFSPASGNFYSVGLGFTANANWRELMYINEEADEFTDFAGKPDPKRVEAAKERTQTQTNFRSSWSLSSSMNPFFQSEVWGATQLQHNVGGLLANNTFNTETKEREWDFGAWDEEKITTHNVATTVAANIMDYNQSIRMTAPLPPVSSVGRSAATLDAEFNKWIFRTTVRTSVVRPWDEDEREFGDISVTERVAFTPRTNFEQTVIFNPREDQYTIFTSRLSSGPFSSSYSVRYDVPWRFNPQFGDALAGNQQLWIQRDEHNNLFEPSLEPRELTFSYSPSFSRNDLWARRMGFSVNFNTSMVFDLQRYTSSRLNFSMSIATRITNFLELEFRATAENAVLYRYFQNIPFFAKPPVDLWPGAYETNFFVDLLNSFRFDSDELRQRSGFKLRSINVTLTHFLGDWNARLTISSFPVLERNPGSQPTYEFQNEITFLIQWVPIAEIRTQIDYTDKTLKVK
ncbi:MAG: LPS-assembly protein LptD [Treponema sp.]|nr:LPS-assembly protein LptD [Treponema sp.]